jgi:sulfate transport system ATP-binding protein
MSIEIQDISKRFGSFQALANLSLRVETGQMVALLGPSGSGKTTLLRIIAGLEQADSGTIRLGDREAGAAGGQARAVGFVFQHYALFRHMTIFENVAFGLRCRPRALRPSKAEIRERVDGLLDLVQLQMVGTRYPHQLSGGQRQRVALARALAVEPEVLLLDEPFGALDARVRAELRRWLRKLHEETGITSVFVTHDQEEALEVADRVAVIHQGRLEQEGTPAEVYEHPANPFVFNFLGDVNLFHGRVHRGRAELAGVSLDLPEHGAVEDAAAVGYVRPHDVELAREAGEGALAAQVVAIHAYGPLARVLLQDDAGRGLEAVLPIHVLRNLDLAAGERVFVTPRQVRVFLDQPALPDDVAWGI